MAHVIRTNRDSGCVRRHRNPDTKRREPHSQGCEAWDIADRKAIKAARRVATSMRFREAD